MIHRVYAARYLKRLFGRHKLLTPEIVELLKLAETSRPLIVGEAARLTAAARWGEPKTDMDVVALGFRAVASNYTRSYLNRVSEICAGYAKSKGPNRKEREIRNQFRDMLEVVWR
jgi:hypothetical protein